MFELKINKKYLLKLLHSNDYKSDNVSFKNTKVFFICNFPDHYFHKKLNIPTLKNYSIRRKYDILNLFNKDSFLISPIDVNNNINFNTFIQNNKFYLGVIFRNIRINQLFQSILILILILRNKDGIRNLLFYNIEFPVFFTAYFFKLLGYNIYLDFEDDYNSIRVNYFKNKLTNLSYKLVNCVIVNNINSKKIFKNKITYLYYGNIDIKYLDYIYDFKLFNGMRLFFSSTLDNIRGATILPDLCKALETKVNDFTIFVSGVGELANFVSNIPHVKYLGYINDKEYENTIKDCDACLVLQLPDLDFSNGSFPSKILDYSLFKKPILILKNV